MTESSEFDSAVNSLIETSMHSASIEENYRLSSKNSTETSPVLEMKTSQSRFNDIEGRYISERDSQSEREFRDLNMTNNFTNGNVIEYSQNLNELILLDEERLRYLELSVGNLQNETYGYIEEIINLNDKIVTLETDLSKLHQYNRRESVEISGIPESIPQENLEEKMVEILRRVGVWGLNHYEIAACHRLEKLHNENMPRVIIRFINRKRAFQCLQSRRYLKDTIWEFPNIYIHDSLCPKHKNLYDRCNTLKINGTIKKLWTYNGIIHIKTSDNYREWPKKVYHLNDLEKYVPDYYR